MESIFNLIKPKDFVKFLEDFKEKYNKSDLSVDLINEDILLDSKVLHDKYMDVWYESIKENYNNPAYWIYGDPLYLSEVFICWKKYARNYIRNLKKLNLKPKRILDLGCGIGFTTVAFSQMYDCEVYGTNIENTLQYDINKFVIEKYEAKRCHIVGSNLEAPGKFDLIFASEFFEHITNPIELLVNILKTYEPKYLVFANSFSPKAIGHFNNYWYNDILLDCKKTSRLFSKTLKEFGYKKVETNFFNGRPAVWKVIECDEFFETM